MPTRVDTPAPVFPDRATVPEAHRPVMPYPGDQYLIAGEVRRWSGATQDVTSPICLAGDNGAEPVVVGAYPLMDEDHAHEALEAAVHAYDRGCGDWPTMSVAERIEHVAAFIPKMQEVRDEVVRLVMWEIGKTYADACKEFDRTIDYIRDTIGALKELDRDCSRFRIEGGFAAQIRRSPLGVVLCMGPFNYPLNETFTTLIPALIMGNTVIFKPPKLGVLLHAPLLRAFAECFPPGVVNTVYGDGPKVIGPLMTSGKIDVLAFIGSARVASILKHQHPQLNRLRCVFGLEAKNPGIVLPHADLETTVPECVLGALSYNGQRCTAMKVFFVHRSIADEFAARFSERVSSMTVGMPWEQGVQITPLPEEGKPDWLAGLVADAETGGAKVINAGGGHIDHTLFHPAVLYPCTPDMQICQVEQFGPVTPIVPYDDEDTVLRWVVDSPVGQQAAIFGTDAAAISRFIDPLVNQVCRVNINCQCQRGPDTFPFTGRKDSAEGTLSVTDALRVFSIRSLVSAKTTEANTAILSDIVTNRRSKFLSTDFLL
jgi:glyceraldehyde-3-phosphate dehydrogenase (NADP+)